MKKFFSLFVIAGVAVIALVVFYLNRHSEAKAKEFKEKLAVAKQRLSEKEAPLRTGGTPDEYAKEQNELMKGYKAELTQIDDSILDPEYEKRKFAESDAKKPISAEQKRLREEYMSTTKAAYDMLMSGNYKPVLTGFNNGARLDITSLKRVSSGEGEVLRADFIAWGFPQEVAWGDINMRVWVSKETTTKGKTEKTEEIKYKFDAASARPTLVINNGERWLRAFPQNATVGYYYLQLIPRDSEQLDLSFHYRMTMETGRVVNVDIGWDRLPASEAIMLPPGAKFEATVRESSDNERVGRAEDAEDPKQAKK